MGTSITPEASFTLPSESGSEDETEDYGDDTDKGTREDARDLVAAMKAMKRGGSAANAASKVSDPPQNKADGTDKPRKKPEKEDAEKPVEEAVKADEVDDALSKELAKFLHDVPDDDPGLKKAMLQSKLDALKLRFAPAAGGAAAPGAPAVGPRKAAHGGDLESRLRSKITGKDGGAAGSSGDGSAPADKPDVAQDLGIALLSLLTEHRKSRGAGSDSEDDREVRGSTADKRLYYKKLSLRRPGFITQTELANMNHLLDPSFTESRCNEPVAVAFLLRAFLPAHPITKLGHQRYREIRTLSEAIDHIMRGDLSKASDVLVARLKSNQRSVSDGHDRVGRWFEVIPGKDDGTSISLHDEGVAASIEAAEIKRRKLLDGSH